MRLTANDRHLRHIKEALLKNFLYFYFFFFFYTYCTCHTFKFTVTLIHGCFKDFTPWHLSPVFWSLCYQRINCKRPCLWILIEAVGWAFFFPFLFRFMSQYLSDALTLIQTFRNTDIWKHHKCIHGNDVYFEWKLCAEEVNSSSVECTNPQCLFLFDFIQYK